MNSSEYIAVRRFVRMTQSPSKCPKRLRIMYGVKFPMLSPGLTDDRKTTQTHVYNAETMSLNAENPCAAPLREALQQN